MGTVENYAFDLPDMEKQHELAELLWAMNATRKSYQKMISATDELVKFQFAALKCSNFDILSEAVSVVIAKLYRTR